MGSTTDKKPNDKFVFIAITKQALIANMLSKHVICLLPVFVIK